MTTIAKLTSAENFQGPVVSASCGLENTVGPEGQRSFHPVQENTTFDKVLEGFTPVYSSDGRVSETAYYKDGVRER